MIKKVLLKLVKLGTILALGISSNAFGGASSTIQVIHNSPGAPAVDLWINGSTVLSGVTYRQASSFLNLNQSVNTVQVAVTGSVPYNVVSTDVVTVVSGIAYRAIASGVVGSTVSGQGFKVYFSEALNANYMSAITGLDIIHSSPNAPAVGVVARGVGTLVNSFTYGSTPSVVTVPSSNYTLDITLNDANGSVVNTFSAPLNGFAGDNIAVIASGLLNDDTTPFGLIAVDGAGNVIELNKNAGVQVIHNSPGAPEVDVWVNGTTVLSGVSYRQASSFLAVQSGVTTVQIAVTGSNPYNIVSTDVLTLTGGTMYRAIASGTVVQSVSGQAFDVFYSEATKNTQTGETGLDIIHSSPNAPTVGVVARGVATLVSAFSFGGSPVFVSVPSNSYSIDIDAGSAGGATQASFTAPLSGFNGKNIAVIASGLFPSTFGLIAVDGSGNVIILPTTTSPVSKVQVIHNSPGAPAVDVWVNGTTVLSGVTYRQASSFLQVSPGVTTVQIAVTGSSPYSIVSTDIITLANETSYRAIASGIVGSTLSGKGFKVYFSQANVTTESGKIGLDIVHSSPDAPTVGVVARGVATLVSAFSFGDAPSFISVPSGAYVLDINGGTAGGNTVISFNASLEAFAGKNIAVIASGLLNSTTTSFGLIAVAEDGTVVLLSTVPATTTGIASASVGNPFVVYPNPASDLLNIDSNSNLSAIIYSHVGQEVSSITSFPATVSNLSDGVYFVKIFENGVLKQTTKLSIVR